MIDLPINSSNTAPAKAANKPASGNPIKQADTQAFGNVLARQLDNADKPNEPSTDASKPLTNATAAANTNKNKTADDEENTLPQAGAENINNLPENILAALLAQPPQAGTLPQTAEQTSSNVSALKLEKPALALNIANVATPFAMQEANPALPPPYYRIK